MLIFVLLMVNFSKRIKDLILVIHFMPLISFDTPLKTSESQRFSDVFRGYQKRLVA